MFLFLETNLLKRVFIVIYFFSLYLSKEKLSLSPSHSFCFQLWGIANKWPNENALNSILKANSLEISQLKPWAYKI